MYSPFTLGIDNRSRNLKIASDIFIENIVSYVFIFVPTVCLITDDKESLHGLARSDVY